jgi:hypothetical protein
VGLLLGVVKVSIVQFPVLAYLENDGTERKVRLYQIFRGEK